MAALVATGDLLKGVHDVSGGGLALALAECAVRSGVGAGVDGIAGHGELFSEAPSRVLACTTRHEDVLAAATTPGSPPASSAWPAGIVWS